VKSKKIRLISASVAPMVAAAALTVGLASSASAAGSGCGYKATTAALPEAKSRNGEINLAMSHENKGCKPCNPCAAKGEKACAPCKPNPCAPKKAY
jgi:multimeric flavodoxin WrbA